MNDYIEKLTIALYESSKEFDWVDAVEPAREDMRGQARSVLATLRDPTDAMKVAGGLKCEAMMFEGDPDFTGVIFNDMGVVFRTMIDAAVEDRT